MEVFRMHICGYFDVTLTSKTTPAIRHAQKSRDEYIKQARCPIAADGTHARSPTPGTSGIGLAEWSNSQCGGVGETPGATGQRPIGGPGWGYSGT